MAAEVTRLEPKGAAAFKVAHDADLAISYGRSRFEKSWKNRRTTWSDLLGRLSISQKTGETHAEYMKLSKDQQDRIKDIGGFVGGRLREGKRRNGYVDARQILTLDVDFAKKGFTRSLEELMTLGDLPDVAMAVYSTHKHSEASPRLRLIVPMDRETSADEYEAIARKLAEMIGIDLFDDSTYQPARLMYWPSHSADVEPVFWFHDAPILSADDILAEYHGDWADTSNWPESSRAAGIRKKLADRQGNPLEKKGIVGAFCRTYTIPEVIEKYLPTVYTPTAKPDRYTYAAGSTAAGLVIYDGEIFAFSNHGTDPAGGQLCNAFDLVRIHRFGALDDDAEEKSGKDRPSYKAMADLARDDEAVRLTIIRENRAEAKEDFGDDPDPDAWKKDLLVSDKGLLTDVRNAEAILAHEEDLQGIRFNEMSRRIDAEGVPWDRPKGPWRDADDAQLYLWIAKTWNVQFPREKFTTALTAVADRRRYHPVREYLDRLPDWDGEKRLDTLLVDLLGAEDTVYVREATRRSLVAAVTRIYEPGAKFDNILVLQGPQGCGKSTFFARLAGDWFSDSLTLTDMRDGKAAAEKIQGSWINEIGEMTGMRKAEIDAVKGFVSRRDDIYRAAYGRNTESRPRQCIIVGSTNDESGFLRDITGNRRFWPVKVTGQSERKPWDLTDDEVGQIWAEALLAYRSGEGVLLSQEAEAEALAAQTEAMEADDRQGIVEAYLERLLPENWDELDQDQKLYYLDSEETGTRQRQVVSNLEIWVEALHNPAKAMEPKDARAITAMMVRIPGWEKTGELLYVNGYGRQRVYRRRNNGTNGTNFLEDF